MKTTAAKIVEKLLSKQSALGLLGIAALLSSTGCSTPAYSAKERGQMIARNWGLEWQMLNEDIDDALLLRPMSTLSRWNVR